MELSTLVDYLHDYLRIPETPDYGPALNGLQVENGGTVRRIAAAVDAVGATIDAAAAEGADLLLVHHGLFWGGNRPVTGRRFRRLRRLIEANIAVYAAHLPLDVHPEVGNNVQLARALELNVRGRFGEYRGEPVGYWGEVSMSRAALVERLEACLGGPVHMVPGGPDRVRRVGIATGGASDMLGAARSAGLDTMITGEAPHHAYFDAEEGGVNLLLGGHYRTEVWGVKALAAHLERNFGLPWVFLDHPTGL